MTLLCSACLHALDDAGFCANERCHRAVQHTTGYTVEPPKFSEAPDPFPSEPAAVVCCPMCGQRMPAKE